MHLTSNDETFRVQYLHLTDGETSIFRFLTACNHSIVLDNFGAAAAMLSRGEVSFPVAREEFLIIKEHFGNWYDVWTDGVWMSYSLVNYFFVINYNIYVILKTGFNQYGKVTTRI